MVVMHIDHQAIKLCDARLSGGSHEPQGNHLQSSEQMINHFGGKMMENTGNQGNERILWKRPIAASRARNVEKTDDITEPGYYITHQRRQSKDKGDKGFNFIQFHREG
jgi:hypothetical protein